MQFCWFFSPIKFSYYLVYTRSTSDGKKIRFRDYHIKFFSRTSAISLIKIKNKKEIKKERRIDMAGIRFNEGKNYACILFSFVWVGTLIFRIILNLIWSFHLRIFVHLSYASIGYVLSTLVSEWLIILFYIFALHAT